MKIAFLVILAASVYAAEPSIFDGSRGASPFVYGKAPATVNGAPLKAKPTVVPPDLAAAAARVSNQVMLSRVSVRPSGAPFTFAVIGDAEKGRFWWERVFNPGNDAFAKQWRTLQASNPDFALQLGDFVSEGTADEYRKHVAFLDAEVRTPLLRCVGNHDRSRPNGDADKNLYDAVFGARDWYFDHGGWRFVSLDSSDRKVTTAQLDWLARVLAAPGPKVVFTHVPPAYIKDIEPLAEVGELEVQEDDEDAQKGYVHDFFTNYFKDGADRFEALVSAGGVKAVYMGHIHAFWAADHKGVRYVISGGGGSPLYPLPPGYPKKKFAHHLRVEASSSGLRETVVPMEGTPFVLPPVR